MTFWDAVCPLIAQLAVMVEHKPLRVIADAYLVIGLSFNVLFHRLLPPDMLWLLILPLV